MFRKSAALVLSLSLVGIAGCKSPEQKAAEEAAKNMAEASKQMQEATKNGTVNMGDAMNALGAAMGAANGGKKVETVDYKLLKNMLPADLSGMKRTDASGEKNTAMGMQISNAEGRYRSDGGASITLKVTDIGSMTGLAGMAAFAWASTEIDRESGDSYEKTGNFNGFKSHEKYDKSSKSGEISVMIANRFVVEASGNDVEMDALKDALTKLDLKKLEGMKNQGVQ